MLPTDTTDTAPVGWQPQAVDLKVDGTDADSGVDHVEWQIDALPPGSGPDGTIVQIGTQGKHVFRTRVVDEVGNVSAWRSQDVWINILGPIDTTDVPTTWYTTPTVHVDITGTDNLNRNLARIQWTLDGQPGGDVSNPVNSPVPVTVAGDGVHQLEVRMTDVDNRVLDWHTHLVKIDTVTPVDLTTIAAGWLPYSSLNVNVHGTDAHSDIQRVEWRIDSGNVGSATSDAHDVTVSGDGVHTLETRVIDNAGLASAWVPRTIKLDATAPTNLTPGRRDGLAQHALLGRARRLGHPLGRGQRQLEAPAPGPGRERRAHRLPRPSRRRRSTRTARTPSAPASATSAAPRPPGAPRPSRSTACCRPTTRPIRARRSTTATSSPSTGRTTGPASPRSSGSSTARPPRPTRPRRSPARATTRSRCGCATTPATTAPGSRTRSRSSSGRT